VHSCTLLSVTCKWFEMNISLSFQKIIEVILDEAVE
jgi:hypothetical protein